MEKLQTWSPASDDTTLFHYHKFPNPKYSIESLANTLVMSVDWTACGASSLYPQSNTNFDVIFPTLITSSKTADLIKIYFICDLKLHDCKINSNWLIVVLKRAKFSQIAWLGGQTDGSYGDHAGSGYSLIETWLNPMKSQLRFSNSFGKLNYRQTMSWKENHELKP